MNVKVSQKELFEQVGACLDELESEYLRVGIEHCKGLEDHSQLSAFVMLGIRSVCLLRGMLRLADQQFLDAYDSVRRAFVESWQLQFELRLRDAASKAQKWLEGLPNTWKADHAKLEAFVELHKGGKPGFGREWGELSELAHPTVQAAVNSAAIASTIAGVNPRPHVLPQAVEKLVGDYLELLNRLIWLTLQSFPEFIDTPFTGEQLPKSLALHKNVLANQ